MTLPIDLELDIDDVPYLKSVILSCQKSDSGYFIYRFTYSLQDNNHLSGEFWILDVDPEGVFLRKPDDYHDYDHPENTSRGFMEEARKKVYPIFVSSGVEDLTVENLTDAFNIVKTKLVIES